MDFFYTTPDLIEAGTIRIEGEEFSHLTHVMRKKPGDLIGVVDGKGNSYDAVIREIVLRTALCTIRAHAIRPGEPSVRLHVAVGVLKNPARFDYLVEKLTELGVTVITPLHTSRTIPHHAKRERWQKIAVSAMKQAGRSVLTQITPLTPFLEFISTVPAGAGKLLFHIGHRDSPALVNGVPDPPPEEVIIGIGPEGGFTEEEAESAAAAGFSLRSLGPLRLRSETAAIAAAARILAPV